MLEDVEKELYDNFKDVDSKISDLMDQKEYTKSLDAFASLKPAVDNFFDNVMVMSDNPKLRTNRLALLKNISDSMLKVCDLTKIVYK